jgi:multiple sugar transport system substrate-binding protein
MGTRLRSRKALAAVAGIVAENVLLVAVVVLLLRPGQATPAASPTLVAATATAAATDACGLPSGAVVDYMEIRWFVGLGSGTQPDQIDAEKKAVSDYNAAHPCSSPLKLEIVPNSSAYDLLKTKIAGGNAPDIIGPVSVKGRNGFEGLFLDLTPYLAEANLNMSQYDPHVLNLLNDGGLVGLPYLLYPAFMFYNRDLFEKAGLPDLPTTVGQKYMGQTWDWNQVKTIGQRLTLDKNGKDPTQAGFDKNNVVQWGIDFQWWDGRRMASAFGGGSFVSANGYTAQIPPVWRDAWKWYYDAMWTSHFAATGKEISSALLNNGATISSGRIAMAATNAWTINSYGSAGNAVIKKWDMAVMPSWKGQTSGPLDVDTFTISKSTRHPTEAFEAMLAIMADEDLMQAYVGMPGLPALRSGYFSRFDSQLEKAFPGNSVTWSVLSEMVRYPAVPSPESNMPNFLQVTADYGAFYTKLQNSPGLDLDAELTRLQQVLQTDFDCAGCGMVF